MVSKGIHLSLHNIQDPLTQKRLVVTVTPGLTIWRLTATLVVVSTANLQMLHVLFIQQIHELNILNMLHTLHFFLFKMPFIS
jgi:hypothetical protein